MNAAVFAETVRRHVTSIGYWCFIFLIATAALLGSTFNTPGALWPSLVALLSIITGSALIGPEFSTGTLQLIVSKPVPRFVYLLSRVAGVLASVAPAAAIGFGVEVTMRLARGVRPVPLQPLSAALVNALTAALLAIALLTLLGSVTRSYFNVAIYFGVEIALSAGETLVGLARARARLAGTIADELRHVEEWLVRIADILYPAIVPQLHATWTLRVAATAAIALVLACAAFHRREVPYSAD